MQRIAYIGASHWHLPGFLNPVLGMEDVKIVGVSDPSESVAAALGAQLECEYSADYQELCDRLEPDFVVALGRHCDMADEANYLIDRRIAFAMEKPCGMNSEEVQGIAQRASDAECFAAVGLVYRNSDFVRMLKTHGASDFKYLNFKFISQPATHYLDDGVAWVLDPAQSGGGALINCGFHFFDLYQYLMPGVEAEVLGATISSSTYGYPVEDYGIVTLRFGESIGVIETGYIYLAGHTRMDIYCSIRTTDNYYVAKDAGTLEVTALDGSMRRLHIGTSNGAYYGRFMSDVLERARRGDAPLASLHDAASALRIIDRVYEMTGSEEGLSSSAVR